MVDSENNMLTNKDYIDNQFAITCEVSPPWKWQYEKISKQKAQKASITLEIEQQIRAKGLPDPQQVALLTKIILNHQNCHPYNLQANA